jgi:hypothetical protein
LVIILLFIITRLIAFYGFAPHNDESIYAEYAKYINYDWHTYWHLSMGDRGYYDDLGNHYYDYKDPLQFWLTSLTVNVSANPLVGVRLFSLLFSSLAFYFLVSLARKKIGEIGAVVLALLWVSSNFYFYFDILGITEVYIYSTAIFLIYAIDYLANINSKFKLKTLLVSGLVSLLFFMGLLFKETMIIIAPILVLIPFLNPRPNKKKYFTSLVVLAGLVLAKLVYQLSIGLKFADKRHNNAAFSNNAFSWEQILQWPIANWLSNLKFYFVKIVLNEYLLVFCLSVCLLFVILKFYHKQTLPNFKKYFIWLLFWLMSLGPSLILLKSQNARHYGLYSYFLFFAIAWFVSDFLKSGVSRKIKFLFIGLFSVIFFIQLYLSMNDIIKYHGTKMSEVEIGDIWASPLGIKELINKIKILPAGVALLDPQWGNPSTTLNIFKNYYPQLSLWPLGSTDKEKIKLLYNELNAKQLNLYLIFDQRDRQEVLWVNSVLDDNFLCGKKEIINKVFRDRIYKKTALVICYVGQGQ